MRSVLADLNFFDVAVEPRKYRWTVDAEHLRPINDLNPDTHQVEIFDLRSVSVEERAEKGLTLEKAGFETLQGWGEDGESIAKAWAERKWQDQEWVETEYYSYVKRLLAKKFNAYKITVYDHTIRQRPYPPTRAPDGTLIRHPPAQQTHIDQTYWAAIERVRLHLGEEAAQSVLDGKTRSIICNLWRPLVGPLLEQPLTAADYRTLDDEKAFGMTAPAPPGCRTGESQMVRFHPDQKWYYLSGMQTDECLLLKCFDSVTKVRSPHSAFMDQNTPPNSESWSMEVRTVSLIEI